MKTLLAIGLVGFLLPGVVSAQEDWVFVRCEIDTAFTTRGVNQAAAPQAERSRGERIYRFNANDFDRLVSGPVSWQSLCAPEDGLQSAACSIDADSVISRREGSAPDTRISHAVTLDRVTGTLTEIHLTETPTASFRHEGKGICEPTTDPTAGRRRF